MTGQFAPHTYRVLIEGIADNFFLYPHFRAFIETDSESPTVMMTINEVSEADKLDFYNAMGGRKTDDGRSGIFVYMRWTGTQRMGDAVTFTVWQKDAQKYGVPEPMPEEGFDSANPTAGFEQGPVASSRRPGPHLTEGR
jgi:hypothetical protein